MTAHTTTPRIITRTFASTEALAAFAATHSHRAVSGMDSWAGGTFAQAQEWLREGDTRYVAQSEALMEKFEKLTLPTQGRTWHNEVAGFVPNVPAYLAGNPQSMRRRKRVESPTAPITVFVDVFASSSFSQDKIVARGAAVLALVRILARFRAVTLWVCCTSTAHDGTHICSAVQINTTPIDLAHAGYMLCGPSFLRHIWTTTLRGMYPQVDNVPPLRGATLTELATRAFGEGTEILVVKGAIVSQSGGDPTRWIEEKIREAAPEVLGAEEG